jgi:transcriptional regulator with XRE-family HTH domain
LTQTQLGEIVGKTQSKIAKLETGAQRPPRDAAFYQRLRQVKGVTDYEVQLLLQASGAPVLLVERVFPEMAEAAAPPRITVQLAPGVAIAVYADPKILSGQDIDKLSQLIKWAYQDLVYMKDQRVDRS